MTPLQISLSEGDDPFPDDILPEGDRNDHVIVPQIGSETKSHSGRGTRKIRIPPWPVDDRYLDCVRVVFWSDLSEWYEFITGQIASPFGKRAEA
ncbi:hypothetical protein TNCT_660511 [Trichonephila clavata]|uniref:Uncharacterized protein n=1 Tax=Trichonephila clavata TaxID=2740835 RepID=A0A8X6J285_TRICU|nr:hypothetical protein TNCT_660511 [Trichonephila clavata]